MPREVRHFTATCPAGTPAAAPVTVDISFPPRVVRSIYWRVPNGPMGVFGWRLSMGGVQVIPTAGDAWVIANDETGEFAPEGFPDSGAWQVIAYNTGTHPHSLYLALHLDLTRRPPPAVVPLSPLDLGRWYDPLAVGPPVPGRLCRS